MRIELNWQTKKGSPSGILEVKDIVAKCKSERTIGFLGDTFISSLADIEDEQTKNDKDDLVLIKGISMLISKDHKTLIPIKDDIQNNRDYYKTGIIINNKSDYKLIANSITKYELNNINGIKTEKIKTSVNSLLDGLSVKDLILTTGLPQTELFEYACNKKSIESLENVIAEGNYRLVEVCPHYMLYDLIYDDNYPHITSEEDLKLITKNMIIAAKNSGSCLINCSCLPIYTNEDEEEVYQLFDKGTYYHYVNGNRKYISDIELISSFDYLGEIAEELVFHDEEWINKLLEKNIYEVPHEELCNFDDEFKQLKNICMNKYNEMHSILKRDELSRLNTELDLINKYEKVEQFVLMYHLINKLNLPPQLISMRGDMGNLFVCYILGFTAINPIEYGLPYQFPINEIENTVNDFIIDIPQNRIDDAMSIVEEIKGGDNVLYVSEKSRITERDANDLVRVNCELEYGTHNDRLYTSRMTKYLSGKYLGFPGIRRHPGSILVGRNNVNLLEYMPVTVDKHGELVTYLDYREICYGNYINLHILPNKSLDSILRMMNSTQIICPSNPFDEDMVQDFFIEGGEPYILKTIRVFNTYSFMSLLNIFGKEIKTFMDLVKIYALSISEWVTDSYIERIINNSEYSLNSIITNTDDLFFALIDLGFNEKKACEFIKALKQADKNSYYKQKWDEVIIKMADISDDKKCICNMITNLKYVYPKSHCINQVLIGLRQLWYFLHYQNELEKDEDFLPFR